jgi:acetoin:2,6-dichlorophenolindophenol oxidoreductase subunit beta
MVASSQRKLTYMQAEGEALRQAMQVDPKIMVLGEDVYGAAGGREGFEGWGGPYGLYAGLGKEFGNQRVIDTPIAEPGFVGMAAGLAMRGYRPVVDIMFSALIVLALEQMVTNVAQRFQMYGHKQRLPIVFRTQASDHGGVNYALPTHMPGLKVVVPSGPYTVKGLMLAALQNPDPIIVFGHGALMGRRGVGEEPDNVPEEMYTLPIGKAAIVREGTDVTLVGISAMTRICVEAAATLQGQGISAEVVDLLSLKPLDTDTILTSVAKTGRLVVVDEGFEACSVAHDLIARVAQRSLDSLRTAPRALTTRSYQTQHTPLSDALAPTAAKVVAAVTEQVNQAQRATPVG